MPIATPISESSSALPNNSNLMVEFVKYIWKNAKAIGVKDESFTRGSDMFEPCRCGMDVTAKQEENDCEGIFSVELLLHIFSFMNAPTLAKCARVCSLWNTLTQDHTLWRGLSERDNYGLITTNFDPPQWAKCWKDAYRFHYECRMIVFSPGQVKEGRGTFIWTNGARYEGEWKNDKEHGRGKKVWMDGATFEGEWEEGKFSGEGIHSWASGSRYQGKWTKHKRNGFGKNVWPQKDVYEGEWLEDQKSGFGTYTWADGRVYTGYWKNDKRCGKGTFVWSPMGYKYEGDWITDRGHGHGTFYWGDGHSFEGEWVNGRRCGKGKYRTPEGRVFYQEWNEEREFNANDRGDMSREITENESFPDSPKRKVTEDNLINSSVELVIPRDVKRRR